MTTQDATPPASSPEAPPPRPGLGRRVEQFVGIRPGEWSLVFLLAGAAFLVICSYLLLKPVSKAVFIAAHGSGNIPYVYLYGAGVVAVGGALYAAAARRLELPVMVNLVMGSLAAIVGLFGVWFLLTEDRGLSAYAFVVFVSAYGVFATAVMWLAMNHVLEPRQARRLIGYMGAGAIAGGITGGYLVSFLAKRVGAENLTWGAIVALLLALLLLDLALWRRRLPVRDRPRRDHQSRPTARLLAEHPYLRLLMALIVVIMLCASMADWLFSWSVEQWALRTAENPGDAIAQYMGFWYSNISVIALPAQLLVTAPLLRRWGIGPALLLLPAVIGLLSLGMVGAPTLAFGTGLKVGDGVMRYSVNKSAVELLYLPLPLWLKDRTKVFMDTTLDRLAKGATGALLLLLLNVLHFGARGVAAVTVGLAAGWIVLSLVLRRRYVETFRDALDRGAIDLAATRVRLDDPQAIAVLRERLDSGDPGAVRACLEMLVEAGDVEVRPFADRVEALCDSSDERIAAAALTLASRAVAPASAAIASRRVGDPDPIVAAAAARVLWAASTWEPVEFVRSLVAREDLGEHGEALAAAAVFAAGEDVPDEVVDRLLVSNAAEDAIARRTLAERLAEGDLPTRRDLLRRLMADPDSRVAGAALAGVGYLRDATLLPFLFSALRRPATRTSARAAFLGFGRRVLPVLEERLWDERVEHAVRRRIPRVIGDVGSLAAHRALVRALELDDPALRNGVLKSLNRMERADPAFHVPPRVLDSEILAECHSLAQLLAMVAGDGGGGPCRRLFERSVRDAVRQGRERAFRLLGLRGAAREWENAFAGLYGENARLRASAVEFTDGSLPDRLRRVVVPLIDDVGAAEALQRVGRHLRVKPLSRQDAYVVAAEGPDRWIAACALLAAAEEGTRRIEAVVRRRVADDDPLVREAAQLAASRLGFDEGT